MDHKRVGLRTGYAAPFQIILGITLVCVCVALGLSARQQAQGKFIAHTAMDFMDTFSTLTLPEGHADLADAVFALCRELDMRLSAYKADSDIGRLNAAEGEAVTLHEDTLYLLREGKAYHAVSGGLFDITIAPVSLLWDFTSQSPILPDAEAVRAAALLVDATKLTVGEHTAQLPAGMAVDLGGVAKGYAAQRAADFLREAGVQSAIVNLGGCVAVVGTRPDGAAWRVGIQQPFALRETSIGIVSVKDMAVVTAGIYERGFEWNGVYYHHILDPETGMPRESDLLSATILAPSALQGDLLSTTCVLLGEAKALALLESLPGIEGILVRTDGSLAMTGGIGTKIPFEEGV